jgi:endonuclease YncB( thermonuclease family)
MRPAALRAVAAPSLGVVLTAACAVATLLVGIALFMHAADAPARAPAEGHVSAAASDLAVLDGETLRLGERVVRLEGISAPARGSLCQDAGQTVLDCGSAAANALSSLVRGSVVDCTIHGHDGHGRPVGDCLAAGRKLSAALVLDGWARADVADLREPEASARAARRGIWRSGS